LEVKIFCNHCAIYREMFRSPDGRSSGGERDKSAPYGCVRESGAGGEGRSSGGERDKSAPYGCLTCIISGGWPRDIGTVGGGRIIWLRVIMLSGVITHRRR